MREALLLWLFVVAVLVVMAVAFLLALGVLFGALWLLWKGCLAAAGKIDRLLARRRPGGVETNVVTVETAAGDPLVPRRVRGAGAQRTVRVQTRLVPPASCVARRDHGGMERRGQAGPRPRHD